MVAQRALDHLGGVDIVVNVLGGTEAPAGGFAVLDDEAWRKDRSQPDAGGATRSRAAAVHARAGIRFDPGLVRKLISFEINVLAEVEF